MRSLNDSNLLNPGDVVDSKYCVEYVAGRGGFAVVYAVQYGGKRYALKMLLPVHTEDLVSQERMLREIFVLKSLEHHNIVQYIDAGGVGNGNAYVVMDFVEGQTLRDELRRGRSLEIVRAIRLTKQICLALESAHKQSIIHRDIKPENIFVVEGKFVLVADWGLARVERVSGGTRQPVGTAEYMPPDQATHVPGTHADPSWDQCALGYVLWEMLTGYGPRRSPAAYQFWEDYVGGPVGSQAAIPRAIMYKIVMDMDIPTLEEEVGCPRFLSEVVARAVSHNPADRFPSIAAFREALDDCLDKIKTYEPVDDRLASAEERFTVARRATMPVLSATRDTDVLVATEDSPQERRAARPRTPTARDAGPRGTIRMTAPMVAEELAANHPHRRTHQADSGDLAVTKPPSVPWASWFGFDRRDKRIALVSLPIVLLVGTLVLGLPARCAELFSDPLTEAVAEPARSGMPDPDPLAEAPPAVVEPLAPEPEPQPTPEPEPQPTPEPEPQLSDHPSAPLPTVSPLPPPTSRPLPSQPPRPSPTSPAPPPASPERPPFPMNP